MSGLTNVKFTSNRTVITNQVLDNLKDAADAIKEEAIEWVQEQMLYGYKDPHGKDGHTEIYDTGYLSEKSLSANVKRDSQNAYTVTVGSDAKYAVHVHEGTRHLKGRPFIRDALEKNEAKIEQLVAKYGGNNL